MSKKTPWDYIVPVVMPLDLQGIEAGKLPPKLLKAVAGGGKLHNLAADAWTAMVAKAKADGVELKPTSAGDTYRDYELQKRGFLTRYVTHDTGTGKTAKAVWVAKKLGKPVAIICPKAVIPAWKHWCQEAGIEPTFVLNYEKLRAGTTPFGDFVSGAWVWSKPVVYDQLFIWDEVHKCKGPNSLNGKMLIASRPYYTLMLSATFASNPLDMKIGRAHV